MSGITNIQGTDVIKDSREVINTNFSNLNTDKVETLSDLGVTGTASEVNDAVTNAPTATEKAALAGGGNFGTPSATNKYATEEFVNSVAGVPQVVTFTSSGTWTKDAGLKYVIVEVQGAGGKGGSTAGGGAGGYSRKLITADLLGSTETVTVGVASVGSGDTSFGTHLIGGNGGNGLDFTEGTGGIASGGDVNIDGEAGQRGFGSFGGGAGGSSFLGSGGPFTPAISSTSPTAGTPGSGYGAGGSGNADASDGTPDATGDGGAGTPGIVIVTEYY